MAALNSLEFLPRPQVLKALDGNCRLLAGAVVSLQGSAALRLTGEEIIRALAGIGMPAELTGEARVDAAVVVEIAPGLFKKAESYKLVIRPGRIHLLAADAAGAWYGAMTLRQLCRQLKPGAARPGLFVEDWPDFPSRGIMLDISRDKVPTMDTLRELVELLSELKINQVQLYTEHTFAYRNHREVWENASAMTAAEILELDAFCRERHIQLVPNQNSFGHLERWFRHKRYLPLAEAPNGFDFPWGHSDRAFSLNPGDPRSIELVREMFDELLPNFSSPMFNVGGDETYDLGQGRSKAACAKRGKGRVYLDFLLKIHREVRRHGRTMQFWGDIILKHPELIPDLPPDVIPLVWGYEDDHPFADQCARYGASGYSFYVAPGTSTWNTLAGRWDNAVGNLRAAAEHGLAAGAAGFLNTDWGDNGHWQPYAVSLPPYAYGAAVSWAASRNRDLDLVKALNRHVFQDPAGILGRVACELGNAYQGLGSRSSNSSNFHNVLFRAASDTMFEQHSLTAATLKQAEACEERIEAALELVVKSRCVRADAEQLKAEFLQAGCLIRWASRLAAARLRQPDRKLAGVPAAAKRALAKEFRDLFAAQKAIWLGRNRPGGLDDSLARLKPLCRLGEG